MAFYTVFFLSVLCSEPELKTLAGKVVKITDGDTIWILDDENIRHKIRLASIDTPERKQPFYKRASKALGAMIHEKRVIVKWKKRDRYKRIIGDVWLKDQWINKQMIVDGWAWHYKRYSKSKELTKAEMKARAKKRGLWAGSERPIPPWEWRKNKKRK